MNGHPGTHGTHATRVKVFIGGVAALLVAGVAVALVYVSCFDRRELRYDSEGALLAAVPGISAGELTARGVALSEPLGCWNMAEATPRKLRVACAGRTTRAKKVQVIAAAEKKEVRQYFTILVDGRPLVQNAPCLGADCDVKAG
jgi:hypothetical protein